MDIIIGSTPPLRPRSEKVPQGNSPAITAQLLHVRPPRKGIAGPSGMERRTKQVKDPISARVLTLMVPDAGQLPPDLDKGRYEVSIRFIRR